MAKMHSDRGHTSVSWGGEVFKADAEGAFDVPDEAVPDLQLHGLALTDDQDDDDSQLKEKPISQWKKEDLLAKAEELGLDLPEDIKKPELIQAVAAAIKPKD